MPDQLYIYIKPGEQKSPADSEVYYTYSTPEEVETVENISQKPLSAAVTKRALRSEVTCIFPCDWVTIIPVQLPRASGRTLRKSLPFMVEEYLIEDIDSYFVVDLGREPSGMSALCAIPRSWLSSWCHWFDNALPNARVRFTIEGLHIPKLDTSITRIETDKRTLIRYGDALCCSLPQSTFSSWFGKLMDEYPSQRKPVDNVSRLSEGELARLVIGCVKSANTIIDLRQGIYRQQRYKTPIGALTMFVASISLGLLLITASNFNRVTKIEMFVAETKLAIEKDYRIAFEEEGIVINPVAQAKNHLAKLLESEKLEPSNITFSNSLPLFAGRLADWIEAESGSLEQMVFSFPGQRYQLTVEARSLDNLNQLQGDLSAGLYRSKLVGAAEIPDGFRATLVVDVAPQ